MSDDYNDDDTTPTAPATFDETISALRRGRTSHPAAVARQTEQDGDSGSFNTHYGTTLTDDEHESLGRSMGAHGTVVGFDNDLRVIQARQDYLRSELERQAGFDPRTGAEVPFITGALRAAFEAELAELTDTEKSTRVAREVAAQRQADEARREHQKAEADAAVFEFTQGDPLRQAALDKALLDREAGVFADWMLRKRYDV